MITPEEFNKAITYKLSDPDARGVSTISAGILFTASVSIYDAEDLPISIIEDNLRRHLQKHIYGYDTDVVMKALDTIMCHVPITNIKVHEAVKTIANQLVKT